MTEPFEQRGEEPHVMSGEALPAARGGHRVELSTITFVSDHAMLKACDEDVGWRDAGKVCPVPEWGPEHSHPLSHTMGTTVRLRVLLKGPARGNKRARRTLRGDGPEGMILLGRSRQHRRSTHVAVASRKPLEHKVQKLALDLRWSILGANAHTLGRTSNTVYVTLGQPKVLEGVELPEQGVTLRRMDKAVEWVAPMNTVDPHEIVAGLMRKFPFYSLLPSPAVPARYNHPVYINDQGGAWPMAEHVKQSGECQAIVRLIRGVLFQLGAPGQMRTLVAWADPNVEGGIRPIFADLERQPTAGLDTVELRDGKLMLAALVDAPVEEGKTYPPPHTRMKDGRPSPGLNRYEACLEFSHGGRTRLYCGGAGILDEAQKNDILRVFWGLIWISPLPDGEEGFRVEKIVQRYQDRGRRGGEGG